MALVPKQKLNDPEHNRRALQKLTTKLGPTADVYHNRLFLTGLSPNGVCYIDSDYEITADPTNFHWDDTNKRLGIGTNTPSVALEVVGVGKFNYLNITDESNGYQIDGTRVLSANFPIEGGDNIFVSRAGNFTMTGTKNVFCGYLSGEDNTTGSQNVGIGKHSLKNNTTGYSNMAIGVGALINNENGFKNTAIGLDTLYDNVSGNRNCVIGHSAGYNCTGSDNVFIGPYAGYQQTTLGNRLIIDNQIRGSAANEITKSLIYGVFDADPANQTLRFNAAVAGTNFISNIAVGTSPYACTSTTLNTNLNADLLDGQHASAFQAAGSYLSNIVEDTTPQLGGDLDGQSAYDLTNMVDGTFSGVIQAAGSITTEDYLYAGGGFYHYGDTDTGIIFGTDLFYFQAGGIQFITFSEAKSDNCYVNPSSNDIDFGIYTTSVKIFAVDAANQTVDIGDGGSTNYSRFSATGNLTLNGSAVLDHSNQPNKPKIYSQADEPNIGNDTMAFWTDTDDGKYYLVLDIGGTQKKAELT